MKAIILAAGVGSRLQPITLRKPKTLVKVNNKAMIDHIVEALLDAGITELVVCIGYQAQQLRGHLSESYGDTAQITFVENENYATTNNMYSLYLAREYLIGDIVLMNADLVFDKEIISGLIQVPGSAIAVDKGRYLEEAMKIVVTEGVISGISKKIVESDAYGSSIDVYKFDSEAVSVLGKYIRHIIEVEQDLNQWTEVLLDRVFKDKIVEARPYDIGANRWMEIDNFADLEIAELIFNDKLAELRDKTTFLLDKDGTIAIGSEPIDGAREFLTQLDLLEKKWVVASNNSSRTSDDHAAKLKNIFGKDVSLKVISSLDHAVFSLKSRGVKSIYCVANSSVLSYLSAHFEFNSNQPDAILLTYDDEIDYRKIVTAIRLVNGAIPYFATHIDMVCPVESGNIPDIGTFIDMIEACTSARPSETFGKPTEEFLHYMLDTLGSAASQTVLIGDRLYTDIKSCLGTDVTSVLVLSGETSRTEYEFSDYQADIVVPSIAVLGKFLQ